MLLGKIRCIWSSRPRHCFDSTCQLAHLSVQWGFSMLASPVGRMNTIASWCLLQRCWLQLNIFGKAITFQPVLFCIYGFGDVLGLIEIIWDSAAKKLWWRELLNILKCFVCSVYSIYHSSRQLLVVRWWFGASTNCTLHLLSSCCFSLSH